MLRLAPFVLATALAAGTARATPPSEEPVAEPARPNPWAVGGMSGALGVTLLASGYFAWWDDGEFVPFTWRKTGLFGPDTPLGGADKAGHFYSFYLITRAITQVYQWLDLSHGWAVGIGAGFALSVSAIIETVDGFTQYGFEWGDALMNLLGTALAVVLELDPRLDRLLGVRMGFVPTAAYFDGRLRHLEILNDYSGMVLHLDLRLAGFAGYGLDPGWLRYVIVGLTHGTQDYGPDGPDKRRNLGVFVGVNIPEVLDALFGRGRTSVDVARRITRYYALPFTEVGLIHDLDGTGNRIGFGLGNRAEIGP